MFHWIMKLRLHWARMKTYWFLIGKTTEITELKLNTYWQNNNCYKSGGQNYWELINLTIWQNNYAQNKDSVFGKLYIYQLKLL